jgi:hypothetical protein
MGLKVISLIVLCLAEEWPGLAVACTYSNPCKDGVSIDENGPIHSLSLNYRGD